MNRGGKDRELQVVGQVAKAYEWEVSTESGPWPDAWLVNPQTRSKIPVEVVSAHPRPPGEDPRSGSTVARGWSQADQMAREIAAAADEGVISGVTDDGQPYAFPISSPGRLPAPRRPLDLVGWTFAAVQQKMQKLYDDPGDVILIVDLQSFPLRDFHLAELGRRLDAAKCQFRVVWVCNMWDESAMQVPRGANLSGNP